MINENDAIFISETTKIRISEEYYREFMNQTENGDAEGSSANVKNRQQRAVFEKDWQRFLWAFILGLHQGKRTPLSIKTSSPFGFDVFKNRNKMLQLIIALCLQEKYKDNPSKLKDDYERLSNEKDDKDNPSNPTDDNERPPKPVDKKIKVKNLGSDIRLAMEEYANTGFAIMHFKAATIPGYIDNLEEIVSDILED